MLFPKLTCFAYPINLIHLKGQKFDNDFLCLYRLEPLKVDVADPLVLQLNVCLNLETLGMYGRFPLI
jgi:hypothetical protein